ncbi:MAG: hypothetical protein PHW02_04875 [bacterium]|nr:hypothetical protein [bacterium]
MRRIKFIKPASSRLFFLWLLFLPVLSFQNTTQEQCKGICLENATLFFKKEITEETGALIGRIKGKIILSGDSVEAYIIYNDTSRTVGYDGSYAYELKENKKITDKSSDKIPVEIDIRTFINPLLKLNAYEKRPGENMVMFFPKTREVDSAALWIKEENIDSAVFYRRDNVLLKTSYSDYDRGFPFYVETRDYEKKTIERVWHYKVIFNAKEY